VPATAERDCTGTFEERRIFLSAAVSGNDRCTGHANFIRRSPLSSSAEHGDGFVDIESIGVENNLTRKKGEGRFQPPPELRSGI
jgi:hypothetical protein